MLLAANIEPAAIHAAPTQQTTRLTYTVQKGDSFYGICYKLGVSADALLKANPGIEQGLEAGQTINVPEPEIKSAPGAKLDTVKVPPQPVAPAQPTAAPSGHPTAAPKAQAAQQPAVQPTVSTQPSAAPAQPTAVAEQTEAPVIVVVQPFMLQHGSGDKHAVTPMEFYRGMLLAADSLSRAGQVRARIVAMDTQGSLEHVRQLCKDPQLLGATAIIAPDDQDQRQAIARAVLPAGKATVFNVFNVHDSLYKTSPNVVQTYLPSERMLEQGAEQLLRLYPDATPVILSREGGRDDKQEFVSVLRKAAANDGRQVIDLSFRGSLSVDDLASLPAGGSYVLVPMSGSANEFAKFSSAVIRAREEAPGANLFELWGYPDWTAFRGANLELLHKLQATIYTRFFDDANEASNQAVRTAYEREYNSKWTDAVPSPVLLGYDLGMYLLQNLQGAQTFEPGALPWEGVQSSYRFVKPQTRKPGYVNDEIYIIRYLPDGTSTLRL